MGSHWPGDQFLGSAGQVPPEKNLQRKTEQRGRLTAGLAPLGESSMDRTAWPGCHGTVVPVLSFLRVAGGAKVTLRTKPVQAAAPAGRSSRSGYSRAQRAPDAAMRAMTDPDPAVQPELGDPPSLPWGLSGRRSGGGGDPGARRSGPRLDRA